MGQGMTIGRPRKYTDPETFARNAEAYFDQVAESGKMPTLAGLSLHMGFTDKQTFGDYAEYGEEYSLTVKRARLRIEDDRNQRLAKSDFSPGIIFDLKNNHGWKDKTETELSGPDGGPVQTAAKLDLSGLTTEQLQALASVRISD